MVAESADSSFSPQSFSPSVKISVTAVLNFISQPLRRICCSNGSMIFLKITVENSEERFYFAAPMLHQVFHRHRRSS